MDDLIYDRTQADVASLTAKGYYNLSDLERIAEWVEFLSDEFGLGLSATDYTLGDLVDIAELLANVAAIRTGHTWSWTPAVPSATAWNYVKANNVEQILHDAELWRANKIAGYRYCGTFTCGTAFEF
ncbi:MAG: hypothetical protein EOM87_05250 [Clostridia bacterium]|nr:hypothetical protein [Clostridia bacterium]